MRRVGLVAAIGLVLLLVILLVGERTFFRGDGGGLRGEEGRDLPARAARDRGDAAGGTAAEDAGGDTDAHAGRDRPPEPPPIYGRLVYLDGAPASGVALHLAAGRAVEVRVFRNGEHTDQTVHLVTSHQVTTTDAEGVFRFAAAGPARARRFVYTAKDPHAFVVEEILTGGQVVPARRRVAVTGRLLSRDGTPLPDYWFEGRAGLPEDWQTRIRREEDLFVAATGDLRVDTLARDDTRTRADGSFSLRLAEGRNTLVFGEARAEGSVDVEVAGGATELGEIRVPGARLSDEERTLAGRVLTLAGRPHAGCEVRAWDGSVGLHTHATETDEAGAFAFEGLRSHEVILWAVPTERRHIDLPVQTTATLRMPCAAPITLQAPSEEEYAWARFEASGFYLFVRKGVFASGDALDATDVVGLPPGPLHIYLVTDRILEASLDIREPGDLVLASADFRDTTWE